MSAAETDTRSIWCCLCCAKPSDASLEESQRLLRGEQDQTVRKQPAKSSYGASDSQSNGTQPDKPKPTESHTQRDESSRTQLNTQDVAVDVVPNKDPDTTDNIETSPQHRPDVVRCDEGHPLHTEDVDVSGNAAAAADKSDIPPQASSPLVDTSSTNISEAPSTQPASLGEATDDKSSIQQSPRSEEKASVETTATVGSSTETAAAAEKSQDDAQPTGKPDEQPKVPDSTKDETSEYDSTKEPIAMPASSAEPASTQSEGDVQQSPNLQSDGQPASVQAGGQQPASLGSFSMLADQGDAKDAVQPEQAQGSLEPVAEEHKVETSSDADTKQVEGTTPTGSSISTDSPPAPDSVTAVSDTVTPGTEDQAGKEAEDAARSEIPATPCTDSIKTDDGEPKAEGEAQPDKSEDTSQDDAKQNNDDQTARDAARSGDKPTPDAPATTEAADKPQEPTGS